MTGVVNDWIGEPNVCLIDYQKMTFRLAGGCEKSQRIRRQQAAGIGMWIGDHH